MLIEPGKKDNSDKFARDQGELKSFERIEQACRQIKSFQLMPADEERE